jgi:hypothetical protein
MVSYTMAVHLCCRLLNFHRDVVAISHPWLTLVIVFCLHWSWILGISRAISLEGYQFSYGQVRNIYLRSLSVR